ncbi:Argininosuccinate synthase [Morus notabilis]|uniref:Argininosuccinate synthase n=1 Tax=Morus notabilis TaxID=981085 RepID=W9S7V9_9ROSA|nr:Argininosuccinate synthase [Morus notabilis]
MVDVASEVGADAVAHGCTGNGNDQGDILEDPANEPKKDYVLTVDPEDAPNQPEAACFSQRKGAFPRELKSLTLDRETMQVKDSLALKYAELVYAGSSRVFGYIHGEDHRDYDRLCDSNFTKDISSFESGDIYGQADAAGFIRRLYGLPMMVRAMLEKGL